MASDWSGYQARPHPSAFSAPRRANTRIEKSADSGRANDKPSNSHMVPRVYRPAQAFRKRLLLRQPPDGHVAEHHRIVVSGETEIAAGTVLSRVGRIVLELRH